jgi:ribose 1,5-bisphosphokinase PhnN
MENDYRKIRKSDRIKVNGEEILDPEDIVKYHKVNSVCIKLEQALMRRRKKKTKRGREKFKEIRRKVENHEEIDDEDQRFVIRMSKRRKKRKEEDTLVTNKKPPDLEKGKSRNQVRKTLQTNRQEKE